MLGNRVTKSTLFGIVFLVVVGERKTTKSVNKKTEKKDCLENKHTH